MTENNNEYVRPSWDEYFMGLVEEIGKRGTCDRGRSGCLIVKDKRLIATGYVGAPAGTPHCDEVGHLMKSITHEDGTVSQHCLRTSHAEANAISQAARFGISLEGATLYCKMVPCNVCCMLLVNAGIKKVVSGKKYHRGGHELLAQAGIALSTVVNEVEKYDNQ